MNFTDLLKELKKEGWIEKDQKGSHVHLTHPSKPGKTDDTKAWRGYQKGNPKFNS